MKNSTVAVTNFMGQLLLLACVVWLVVNTERMSKKLATTELEVCSYYCLHHTGKWPTRAEFKGRDATGHAKCVCLKTEE
jgi:hypothetical protein